MGHSYLVANGGQYQYLSGTSATAPAVAGMISLLNTARLANGLGLLGFLNPLLYSDASVYNDITSGHTLCTAYGALCCSQGFYATPGWDAATGWGSINFPAFLAKFGTTSYQSSGVLTPAAAPTRAPTGASNP
jgi:tripeptidyl-peptidase-1